MYLKDFYFDLPERLIAQKPLQNRETSRLLCLDKLSGHVSHHVFSDILSHLSEGDCLVLNDTRVIPARLLGTKEHSGGNIEFVLLKKMSDHIWEILVRPGKKAKPGSRFIFGNGLLTAEILDVLEDGNRVAKFEYQGRFEAVLDEVGTLPLPPYIRHSLEDKERYQTVYSKHDGSAAAPTAGLHFTKELLQKIQHKGIQIAYVTLHIGLGTFRPVKVNSIEEHIMHSEEYNITQQNADLINTTKRNGKKVIAVGTTSCRVLETAANEMGFISADFGNTNIFIYPGHTFRVIDGLITNFHLPESTLVMLVSALAGHDFIMKAYKEAIDQEYRFFSFGDAMLII